METVQIVKINLVREKSMNLTYGINISSPEDAEKAFREYIGDSDREVFVVMTLNNRNSITSLTTAFMGSLNSCVVHPREVFKTAILSNAEGIILCHNHPSGECKPSSEDIAATARMIEAGKILGIQVLDHIILGDEKFTSMKQDNLM